MAAEMIDSATVIASVCAEITKKNVESASALLREQYPFARQEAVERKYGTGEALRLFIRDGFIDRYSGARLVFPGALRLLSHLLPREFPFHPNWKMTETHPAYWQLTPTVDHLVPVCLGGSDAEENWVTTSMVRNAAKANWTIEQLGWTIHPPGILQEWDGQLGWFKSYVAENPAVLKQVSGLRVWHRGIMTLMPASLDRQDF